VCYLLFHAQVCTSVGLCSSSGRPVSGRPLRGAAAAAAAALRDAAAALRGVSAAGLAAEMNDAAWREAAAKVRSRYGHDQKAAAAAALSAAAARYGGSGSSSGKAAVPLTRVRDAVNDAVGGATASSSNNMGCDFCNMAVEYIKLALHNNQTKEQIEEVSVCVRAYVCVHVLVHVLRKRVRVYICPTCPLM
jgi:Saposin-like type B, region 1